MSDTVPVKYIGKHLHTLFIATRTKPARFFYCQYDGKNAYVNFVDQEGFGIYEKLQIVSGLFNEDSTFMAILMRELNDFDNIEWRLESIYVEEGEKILNAGFEVKKGLSIDELVRLYYTKTGKYIVFNDDLEADILDRKAKMDSTIKYVLEELKENVVVPLYNERYGEVHFSSKAEEKGYEAAFMVEGLINSCDFVQNLVLPEDSSEEEKLYLEAFKAGARLDFDCRDEILQSIKSI